MIEIQTNDCDNDRDDKNEILTTSYAFHHSSLKRVSPPPAPS